MTALLIVVFCLFQLLHADEFPNLMKHVEMTWDKQPITLKIDARQTMSTDGLVPSFILCGAFPTSESDGNCTLKYDLQYHPTPSTIKVTSGNAPLKARFISSVNDSYSCMNFENNMTDFMTFYSLTEQDPSLNKYSFAYTCTSINSGLSLGKIFGIVGFVMFAFMMVVICGYKTGAKKAIANPQQNVYNYKAYEPMDPAPVVYGGNAAYGGGYTGSQAKPTTDGGNTTNGGHTLYTPFQANNGY